MKKFLICIFSIILFTGCGSTKLKCEKYEKKAGYDYSESYELVYEKNQENLKQIKIKTKYSFNEFYTNDEINEEYSKVLKYCESYESDANNSIKCKSNLKGTNLNVDIIVNATKIDDSLFQKLIYVTKNEINELVSARKKLENVGYSCK